MKNIIQFPEPKKEKSNEILLGNSEVLQYIIQRGTFSKDYESQMKEGQERYLLQGLLALMNGSEEFEIRINQESQNGKERILIFEPFSFLNLMGHSSPSIIVFEVYKHYGFLIYYGNSNGLECFDEQLIFHKKINTSAIKADERVSHFINTLTCDCDDYHENDSTSEGEEVICPKCNSKMVLRKGPHGEFYGCSKYPDCKGTKKKNSFYNMPFMPEDDYIDNSHLESFGDPNDFGDHN